MPNPTPGQVAYEYWLAVTFPARNPQQPPWQYGQLSPETQRAWAALAQAALARQEEEGDHECA